MRENGSRSEANTTVAHTRRYKETGESKVELVGDHLEFVSDFDEHGYFDGHGGQNNDGRDERIFNGVRFTTVFQEVVHALPGSDHHLQFLLVVISWPNNPGDASFVSVL
jgi:hypothetical protein